MRSFSFWAESFFVSFFLSMVDLFWGLWYAKLAIFNINGKFLWIKRFKEMFPELTYRVIITNNLEFE